MTLRRIKIKNRWLMQSYEAQRDVMRIRFELERAGYDVVSYENFPATLARYAVIIIVRHASEP